MCFTKCIENNTSIYFSTLVPHGSKCKILRIHVMYFTLLFKKIDNNKYTDSSFLIQFVFYGFVFIH